MARLTVRMPALSATMEEAELVGWLVDVGDEVRSGEPLAEVATDKVDMELECPYDGTVAELLVQPPARVALGAAVAVLDSEEEDLLGDLDLDGSAEESEAPITDSEPGELPDSSRSTSTAAEGDTNWSTPVKKGIMPAPPPVRKRAKDLGIDLAAVTPTGSRGQVTHADLKEYLAKQGGSDSEPTEPGAPGTREGVSGDAGNRDKPSRGASSVHSGRKRAIRLATARTTIRSASVPQFTLHRKVDVGLARERRQGRSWATEIARALAAALWRHPECNAVWDDDQEEVIPLDTVRIGIAVDTADGLLVVGVDDPDGIDPSEADRRVKNAIDRARNGRINAEDQRGLSTTISNLGGFGVDHFDALLLPPQSTILSVGRIAEVPVVTNGRIRTGVHLNVGLTVDHRVLDGADAARMLDTFARRLEA